MAHNTIAKWILLLLCCTVPIHAQYTTNYTVGVTDLTSYTTSTNLWKLLGGGGTCNVGTMSLSYDGTFWCVGIDFYPYSFSVRTQTYTKHTEMGHAVYGLAVQDASNIWMLSSATNCSNSNGVYKWSGSAWTRPNTTICLNQFTIGSDGVMAGILNGTTPANNQLYQSTDGGITWNWWSSGWTYIAAASADSMCAVDGGHQLYWVSTSQPAMLMSPPGSTVGCAIGQGDPVLMTWDTAHGVHLGNFSSNTWNNVSGLSAYQLVSVNKGATFGTDASGHPYHWNVYAAYIGGQTTGAWNSGCPGPGNICNPNATHTGTLQVKFPHSINGTLQTQTIPYNGAMNLTAWDSNPGCDLLFGNPSDPECQPTSSGQDKCNQSGANIGNPGTPPADAISEDYAQWDDTRTVGATTGPVLGLYGTPYTCGVNHNGTCQTGTAAVCQMQHRKGEFLASTAADSARGAAYQCLKGPWSTIANYVPGVVGAPCIEVAVFEHAPIPGYCF